MESCDREMFPVCRFCLTRNDVNPLTKSKDYSFTTEDIQHFTGIYIEDGEWSFFAICDRCTAVLEKSVAYRHLCISNDNVFKQFLSEHKKNIQETLKLNEDCSPVVNTASIKKEKDESEKLAAQQKLTNVDEPTLNENEETTTEWTDEPEKDEEEDEATDFEVQYRKPRKKVKRKKQLCVFCGKFYSNISTHIKNHTMEKWYKCTYCDKKMSNQTNMKRHIESVHEKKIIKCCEQCGKGFTHQNMYLSHMMAQHGIGKTYECKVCSKTFNQFHSYSAHKNRWHRIREHLFFSCTICQKKLSSKRKLDIHQRVHSSDQPYACNLCPKRFKSSYARKTHEMTHSGVRFSCKLCEKSYSYKSLLNMHLRKDHPDTGADVTKIKKEVN